MELNLQFYWIYSILYEFLKFELYLEIEFEQFRMENENGHCCSGLSPQWLPGPSGLSAHGQQNTGFFPFGIVDDLAAKSGRPVAGGRWRWGQRAGWFQRNPIGYGWTERRSPWRPSDGEGLGCEVHDDGGADSRSPGQDFGSERNIGCRWTLRYSQRGWMTSNSGW
jgi:hypothetical protein